MTRRPSVDDLWNAAKPNRESFDPSKLAGLPQASRQYLKHAIAAGTPLASAVRLRMHGSIKLKGWYPFEAEEVIHWDQGFIWRATVKMHGVPIRGADVFAHGRSEMYWKLFGIVPLVNASGVDITRSAAGRMNVESIWLPSVLPYCDVTWTESSLMYPRASFSAHGETAVLDYTIAENGRLLSVSMPRWGNPGGVEFGYYNCGGIAEEEGTFQGYTIPTRLRVGWHFGTARFDREGEFFRVLIDDAEFR